MRYQLPTDEEAMDLLDDEEIHLYPTERLAIAKGRAKAWAAYRASGPTGQLRELALGSIGDSILLTGYTQSSQIGPLLASVSLSEGVQFRCKLERSLVDDSVAGVRVTLVAFTR